MMIVNFGDDINFNSIKHIIENSQSVSITLCSGDGDDFTVIERERSKFAGFHEADLIVISTVRNANGDGIYVYPEYFTIEQADTAIEALKIRADTNIKSSELSDSLTDLLESE